MQKNKDLTQLQRLAADLGIAVPDMTHPDYYRFMQGSDRQHDKLEDWRDYQVRYLMSEISARMDDLPGLKMGVLMADDIKAILVRLKPGNDTDIAS